MQAKDSNVVFAKLEEEILDYWEKNQIFAKSNEIRNAPLKTFSFYDGPPFANGLPHYGHLLANTIKDTVPRYWNMKGYRVERRFGWDCHGLPVEFEIEKTHNLSGRSDVLKMGVGRFNELCRASVLHYTSEWQKTIKRLGRWVDWNNQYRTMDTSFMESVWWGFGHLFKKGLVYQGHKVVPYSPRITAVLSNFEANQNYKDVQDPAITVKFKLVDEEAYLLAWTTTPWTLVSNLALAVGEEIQYLLIREKESGECYYLAEDRLEEVLKKGKQKPEYEVLNKLSGRQLAGRCYEPLFGYFKSQKNAFKVTLGDFVTTDTGTGVVHCAPAYGEDDHRLCQENHIELVDPLDEEARFLDIVPELQGLYIKDADKEIIQSLKAQGKLFKHETIKHSYPFCERTDEPLIYRAIPAWFVRVEDLKDRLVANNKKINWVPEHIKSGRMGKWLENARDWAISRNRFWGTPIPIWRCETDSSHIEVIDSVAILEKRTNSEVRDLHKHYVDQLEFKCEKCQGRMVRIPEVFDCWFESGSMPFAQHHYPFENKELFESKFPADFIAEGLDQTRGWFYTLSVLSEGIFQSPAFKNVIVNGLVLAKDGRKMSKRWRNYTPPEDLIDTFGADGVRLYMLNSAILRGEDLKFSDQGVKDTIRAVLLPLWNAHSFLTTYAKADHWEPEAALFCEAPNTENILDRWLVSRFQSLIGGVQREMEAYRLYNVVPEVLGFISDLTNWYIRLSRRRFWVGAEVMSDDTREAYETLFFILCNFCKILAPFAPFISEAIYRNLAETVSGVPESVHLSNIPIVNSKDCDLELESNMDLIRRVTELGRSLRSKHQIKTRQVLSSLRIITAHQKDQTFVTENADLIKAELNVKNIEFTVDEKRYVDLIVKPNLRTLGKRLGRKLGDFRKFLNDLNKNQKEVASFLSGFNSTGQTTWGELGITLDDLLIERSPKDSQLVASDRGVTVLLDTTLTEDLIREGTAREIVNRVQNLRKDAGLDITDRIHLHVAGSQGIAEAVLQEKLYISGEVLADNVTCESGEMLADYFSKTFEIHGEYVNIGIKRV